MFPWRRLGHWGCVKLGVPRGPFKKCSFPKGHPRSKTLCFGRFLDGKQSGFGHPSHRTTARAIKTDARRPAGHQNGCAQSCGWRLSEPSRPVERSLWQTENSGCLIDSMASWVLVRVLFPSCLILLDDIMGPVHSLISFRIGRRFCSFEMNGRPWFRCLPSEY